MKDCKIKIHITVWVSFLCFIGCCILSYKGFPYDILKKENRKEIDFNRDTVLNGYSYGLDSVLLAICDDPNITMENMKGIRTLILIIEEINFVEDDNEIKIYYAKADENFSEEFSIKQRLRIGKNIITLPYDLQYEKIRLDIGNKKDESIRLIGFDSSNKFKNITQLFIRWIFSSLVLTVLIYFLLYLREKKEILKEKNEKINEGIFYPLNYLYEELKQFIKQNKAVVIGIIIVGVITFGAQIWNYTLSIDEENNLMNKEEYLIYFASGRYTLALFLRFFSCSPYFNLFIASTLMCISAFLLCLLLDKIVNETGKKTNQYMMFFCAGFYISMPYVIGETFNFAMQGPFIALAYCLVIGSIFLLNDKNINHIKIRLLWSLIFSVISFGAYQSFMIVYIFIVASLVLLKVREDIYIVLKYLFRYIVVFIVSAILYLIINHLCGKYIIPHNDYLENTFVGWNKHMPNDWVWKNVWMNWYKVITGKYYNMTGGWIVKISILIYAIYSFISIVYANKWNRTLLIILYPLMLILPFSIPLSLGSFIMLGRSLNAFPVLLGFIWFIVLQDIRNYKILFKIVTFISSIMLIYQVRTYNEFVYIDQLRYRLDIELANLIMNEVYQIEDFTNKSLVFIGTYDFKNSNNLYMVSGCESFFGFQSGDNYRVLNFLYLSGYDVRYPTQEQYEEASIAAENMPIWPNKGSILDKESYIVINLGRN